MHFRRAFEPVKLIFATNCPRNNYLWEPRISFFTADGVPEQKMILVQFVSHADRWADPDAVISSAFSKMTHSDYSPVSISGQYLPFFSADIART
jgi:hypothetical protein